MSVNLIQEISENELAVCGKPLATTQFKLYQINFKSAGFTSLPQQYWEFIKTLNGVHYNGAELYALNPETKAFKDLLTVNQKLSNTDTILLGENEQDWLVFDADDEEFQILDKTDLTVWKHSENFEPLAAYLLKI